MFTVIIICYVDCRLVNLVVTVIVVMMEVMMMIMTVMVHNAKDDDDADSVIIFVCHSIWRYIGFDQT